MMEIVEDFEIINEKRIKLILNYYFLLKLLQNVQNSLHSQSSINKFYSFVLCLRNLCRSRFCGKRCIKVDFANHNY